MKTRLNIWIMAIVAMFMVTACSEEAGLGDGTTISGTVMFADGAAAGAIVYLSYGATEATSNYDQATVADANGAYNFAGLNKGDYFVDAVYTNNMGIEFNSPGFHVEIGGKSDEVNVNFNLK